MFEEHFRSYRDGIYLLNHSVGRPPVDASDFASRHFFQHWDIDGSELWPDWLQEIDGFREQLAILLNTALENFCPQTNLSATLGKLLPALPNPEQRRVIVYSEHDFPSMGFVLLQAQRAGYQLRCIEKDRNPLHLQTWSDHLDEAVLCVLVTHVHSNTSVQVDVAAICELVRNAGAISIADVAQSVGGVPIDLHAWNADFVMGSCVKWLCGGPGAGFLWANPNMVNRCKPVDVGWWSHADPFEFDIHNFNYAEGVLRFWGGTPSVLPYVVAANSIALINEISVNTIRQHNLKLNQRVLDGLPEGVAVTPTQAEQRGGTLVLNFADRQSTVEAQLTEAGVAFDARPTGIRLSPHIYNSNQELDTVIACLQT